MSRRLVEVSAARPDPEMLRRCYETVLRPSFPTSQLASFEGLVAGLDSSPNAVMLVILDDDEPVAVVTDEPVAELRLGFLTYAATRPDRRSNGIGGALMRELQQRWESEPVDHVLTEVEDPRAHSETAADRTRSRVRFYERHGAQLVMAPWVQPGLGGGPRVPHMLLLRVWAAPTAPDGVPSSTLAAWADSYYELEEGAVPADAEFRAVRAGLSATDVIPVRPMDELHLLAPLRVD